MISGPFATLVASAGAGDLVAMRLLRDAVPGVASRYIDFPLDRPVVALKKYSPLTQVLEAEGGEENYRRSRMAGRRGRKRGSVETTWRPVSPSQGRD